MKNLKHILLAITIILGSCTNDDTEEKSAQDSYTIHVVGIKSLSNGLTTAMYWKDGVRTELASDSESKATAIVVANNDVYISGKIGNKACYWKNGVVNYLTEGDEANDIKVIGNDVYVAGSKNVVACYWKNGVKTTLGNSKGNSIANKIIIDGSDVYVAGGQSESVFSYDFTALYWRNTIGNPVVDNGAFNTIAVQGDNVYAAGYQNTDIRNTVFWKNNTAVTASVENGKGIYISGLQVYKNDVYTVGTISGNRIGSAVCWKNNVATTLANTPGTTSSSADDIIIIDGINFICGSEFSESTKSKAKIWINEKEILLSDGTNPENTTGIFVVKNK